MVTGFGQPSVIGQGRGGAEERGGHSTTDRLNLVWLRRGRVNRSSIKIGNLIQFANSVVLEVCYEDYMYILQYYLKSKSSRGRVAGWAVVRRRDDDDYYADKAHWNIFQFFIFSTSPAQTGYFINEWTHSHNEFAEHSIEEEEKVCNDCDQMKHKWDFHLREASAASSAPIAPPCLLNLPPPPLPRRRGSCDTGTRAQMNRWPLNTVTEHLLIAL